VITPAWRNHKLSELLPSSQCIAAALTRSGQAMLPSLTTRLEPGDILYVSATLEGISALQQSLNSIHQA
jgi:hypothetical protein